MTNLAIDGKRVLADLNTLRNMGAYKTGVHKPSLSEPHMQSLKWLVSKLPEADLTGEIDGTYGLGLSTLDQLRRQGLVEGRADELLRRRDQRERAHLARRKVVGPHHRRDKLEDGADHLCREIEDGLAD